MATLAIVVESDLARDELEARGVFSWEVWEKEASTFPWTYDGDELCYLLEGQVAVTTEAGVTYRFGAGDFVRFPAGLTCTWTITQDVRKHFLFP